MDTPAPCPDPPSVFLSWPFLVAAGVDGLLLVIVIILGALYGEDIKKKVRERMNGMNGGGNGGYAQVPQVAPSYPPPQPQIPMSPVYVPGSNPYSPYPQQQRPQIIPRQGNWQVPGAVPGTYRLKF